MPMHSHPIGWPGPPWDCRCGCAAWRVSAPIGCLAAIRWVLVSIGSNISETVLTKRDHHLVMHGPYRWIRHPLYAVALLLLLLLALLADSWFLLLFPLVGFFVFRWIVIPREEANLIKVFGEQYEAYRRRTGALFPRIADLNCRARFPKDFVKEAHHFTLRKEMSFLNISTGALSDVR